MSYNAAAALQTAVFGRLSGWPGLAGVPVVDELPSGGGKGTFVLLGPETAVDKGDGTGAGAVSGTAGGFSDARLRLARPGFASPDSPLTISAMFGRGITNTV